MKFVQDDKYKELVTKAAHWDNLQSKMTEGMTVEEASAFTPEAAVKAIEEATNALDTDEAVIDLKNQVKTLTTEKETLTTEKQALTTKVQALEKQAGSRGAAAITETEVTETQEKGVASASKSFAENLDAVENAFKSVL
jgi:exosome complex RNA-binding protein Csl4